MSISERSGGQYFASWWKQKEDKRRGRKVSDALLLARFRIMAPRASAKARDEHHRLVRSIRGHHDEDRWSTV